MCWQGPLTHTNGQRGPGKLQLVSVYMNPKRGALRVWSGGWEQEQNQGSRFGLATPKHVFSAWSRKLGDFGQFEKKFCGKHNSTTLCQNLCVKLTIEQEVRLRAPLLVTTDDVTTTNTLSVQNGKRAEVDRCLKLYSEPCAYEPILPPLTGSPEGQAAIEWQSDT